MKHQELKEKIDGIGAEYDRAGDDPTKLKLLVLDCLMVIARIMTEGIEGFLHNVSGN